MGGRASGRFAQEQAALRRLAVLVARGATSEEVFGAATAEVGRLLSADYTTMSRYDADGEATIVGAWSEISGGVAIGMRLEPGGRNLHTLVFQTHRPARIDDYAGSSASAAESARELGIRTGVGVPVSVEGRLWGVITASSTRDEPLPPDTEEGLASFTELIATAIANAQARLELRGYAEEQAAVRRVATLVAQAAPPEEVFIAVSAEVGQLLRVDHTSLSRYDTDGGVTVLGAWNAKASEPEMPVGGRVNPEGRNVIAHVFETGRPARMDSCDPDSRAAEAAQEGSIHAAVGVPIRVGGTLWGVGIVFSNSSGPLPPDTETRLARFTELVGTAISNAQDRLELRKYGEEQAALRRVATLVARGTQPEEVFAAVANEVGRLLSVDVANVCRYEADGTVAFVASAGERIPVGSRWPVGQTTLTPIVLETGRPARVDNYVYAPGQLAESMREEGIRSAVGTPILVEGRLWGLIAAGSSQERPLPLDTEARLASFTDLVATAIANTEARTEVQRLVDEQAALRRVATLVAEGAAPEQVFAAVAEEIGRLLGTDIAMLSRYDPDDEATVVGAWPVDDAGWPLGSVLTQGKRDLHTLVRQSGRSARLDDYSDASSAAIAIAQRAGTRNGVGVPISVDGRLWGIIGVGSGHDLAADTEERLAAFMELVATAIANTEARTEVAASRARIVAAADEERRRVVRDLHDGAQQRLVHTILVVAQAQKAIQADPEAASEFMADALVQAEAATEELRELAHGLLPEVLTHGGLRAAVKVLARRTPVPVDVAVSL